MNNTRVPILQYIFRKIVLNGYFCFIPSSIFIFQYQASAPRTNLCCGVVGVGWGLGQVRLGKVNWDSGSWMGFRLGQVKLGNGSQMGVRLGQVRFSGVVGVGWGLGQVRFSGGSGSWMGVRLGQVKWESGSWMWVQTRESLVQTQL